MNKVAVIDLGSNTFHLLIVEPGQDGAFKELFRQRIFTGLGDGGKDYLKPESISRGITACQEFAKHLKMHQCTKVAVTGTAALRTAHNSQEFTSEAEKVLGSKITIINGDREAELIFKGVQLLNSMDDGNCYLIMDIGGGSTEFIIVKDHKIQWAKSFKLGVGILHSKFHHEEPISSHHLKELRLYIKDKLSELYHQCQEYQPSVMVGASGSFEILESMSGKISDRHTMNTIPNEDFHRLSAMIISSSDKERLQMKGLPIERVKLIVVAMVLLEEVIHSVGPKKLLVSPYALKEGLLSELI